jgi:ketosteroid isomerase-like protein
MVTPNKRTVSDYMEAFRQSDRAGVLSCLADDVEWILPGLFHVRGKQEFDKYIVAEGFVSRMIEEGDVVMAEGRVRARKTDGTILQLIYCDVFDMKGGKIQRLVSYLMEEK